jgi:hypothetical protein
VSDYFHGRLSALGYKILAVGELEGKTMVAKKEIIDQLKKLNFNYKGWGRSEVSELPHIILPGEEIYECVNGAYDGGFALLVATNVRVLLIDKKPLNYLTVEDMRFDMISELDYNHRLIGADINIASGGKNLYFRSYNKPRLRQLMGHVQRCMAESKRKQGSNQEVQVQHLRQINKQLRAYLVAQQQYQKQLNSLSKSIPTEGKTAQDIPEPPKPSNELADFLFTQSLMAEHSQRLINESQKNNKTDIPQPQEIDSALAQTPPVVSDEDNPTYRTNSQDLKDIYKEGMKEVFVSGDETSSQNKHGNKLHIHSIHTPKISISNPLEINPIMVAYSKLPMLLRQRKFGNIQGSNSTPDTFLSNA